MMTHEEKNQMATWLKENIDRYDQSIGLTKDEFVLEFLKFANKLKPNCNYVWAIYNFVNNWKNGHFGVVTLQEAIDKHLK